MQCCRLGGVHPSPTLVLFKVVGLFPPASPLMSMVGAEDGDLVYTPPGLC